VGHKQYSKERLERNSTLIKGEVLNTLEYNTRLQGEHYKTFIDDIIKRNKIESIVETGAYDGMGSSQLLASTGLPFDTIECHGMNFIAAKVNLEKFKNARVHHAYSLKLDEMLEFIKKDDWTNNPDEMMKLGVKFDHENPRWYYTHELNDVVSKPPQENVLMNLITNPERQLVFLDSSGGVGLLEFQKVKELPKEILKEKLVMLDDINHIKHYRSLQWMKENCKVEYSEDGRLAVSKLI
jgi:hypothetical protein